MRGALETVQARLAGIGINRMAVHLCAGRYQPQFRTRPGVPPLDFLTRTDGSVTANVFVERGDGIGSADLRCANGLPVFVTADAGLDDRRFDLAARLQDFAPRFVAFLTADGRAVIWSHTGLEEVLEWAA